MNQTYANAGQPAPNLNAIGQLVRRLAEQQPQHWCLIGPDGRCWIGPDPLALAAQAACEADRKLRGAA